VSASRIHKPAGPIVPVAIVALIVVLAWSLYPAFRLQYQASRSLAGIEQQSADLKARNAALRAQVAALKTPQGVEKAAREALGYAKKGDHAYVVVSGQATSTATGGVASASVAGSADPSLWQLALDALFGVQQPTSTVEP
jgi:cell division protein FtsL